MSGLLRVIDVLYKTCALLSQLIMVCSYSLLFMALRSSLLASSAAFDNLSDILSDRYTAAGQCGSIGLPWSSFR